jgi:hypothetical protein
MGALFNCALPNMVYDPDDLVCADVPPLVSLFSRERLNLRHIAIAAKNASSGPLEGEHP